MAIVQISKITQRSGNIVDLPQLDNAELGWASDARQLFIGNDNNITGVENVEVLTSYSTIDFDQINGSSGNLNIDGANLANGQVMTYDGVNWTNRGGNVGGLINLGEVSNVKIDGGAIGYVLQTDGTGNLSWAPKTTITAFIQNASQVNSPNTTVTNTTVTTDIITVDNSASFPANTAVYFTSAIGGLLANNTYYIRNNISTTQVTVSTTLGGGNVTLSTASGSLTMRKVELEITTTENNDFVKGQQVTITNVPGMTQLNGNSFYANVLTSNTFSLYTDASLTIPVNAVTYGVFPYTSVTATSSTSDQVTVGDATPFTINDPVIFVGNTDQSNSNIIAGQPYYVLTKDTSAPNTWITLSETVGGSTLQLGNSTITANVFTSGGRAIATISGSGTTGSAGGSNTSVQYNNSGIITGDSDFTWAYAGAKVLTINGNANVGNLNSTSTVNANVIIARVTTGTAPLTITSTTRVANLNVNYANVSDFGAVTTQTAGTFFPVFVSGSTSGNYALASNANISFNSATGNLSATLLNANSNINVGGNVNLTRNIYLGNTTEVLNRNAYNSTNFSRTLVRPSFDLNNTGTINSADSLAFSRYINSAPGYDYFSTTNAPPYILQHVDNLATGIMVLPVDITAYAVGVASPGTVYITGGNANGNGVSSYIRVGATTSDSYSVVLKGNSFTDGEITASNTISATGNITGGNLITTGSLSVTGNANVGNLGTTGSVTATGNIQGANLIATTSVNTASVIVSTITGRVSLSTDAGGSLSIGLIDGSTQGTPYIDFNSSKTAVDFDARIQVSGNTGTVGGGTLTITAANTNVSAFLNVTGTATVGNLSTGGTMSATGNVTGGNLISTGYLIRSVGTGISATGTNQLTATALNKEFNAVSTGSAGQGVRLPSASPGMAITINNTTGNSLLVYPATNAAINSLTANSGYSHANSATLQYVAFSSTQWYTVGATYA